MNNDWMVFYRETDYAHFFFNGEWPIAVRPQENPWGAQYTAEAMLQHAKTSQDVPALQEVLKSRKKVFTINKLRYVVLQRGQFIND